ncbi:hypothetical protein Pen02_37070 [Plantactinospora endophytica]|uniref:Uncharacterized protein n=1 Tax=Plantactinospora endophytica TaxID=673535 RepID=A0ABQ4E370_9ACTN|nr:hypothetical protein Pen02_37070 [Plantactinospora endophytica]
MIAYVSLPPAEVAGSSPHPPSATTAASIIAAPQRRARPVALKPARPFTGTRAGDTAMERTLPRRKWHRTPISTPDSAPSPASRRPAPAGRRSTAAPLKNG